MGQPIKADVETLHKAATDIRSTRTDVEGDLRQLWDAADDLAIAWKGAASQGFQQLMDRWNGDVKNLLTAMGDIADLLDKSAVSHQVNDENNNAMMQKFGGALNP